MDVIGFLCVSLGSSTIHLHDSLGRRRACACSEAGFSSQNGDHAWTRWTKDQPVARPLPTRRTTQTQIKPTQTSMFRVGFEPTIPVFERANIVHALDCAATVIGAGIHMPVGSSNVLTQGLIFCKVTYTGYGLPLFVEWVDFSMAVDRNIW
jgi:hypothetical protein